MYDRTYETAEAGRETFTFVFDGRTTDELRKEAVNGKRFTPMVVTMFPNDWKIFPNQSKSESLCVWLIFYIQLAFASLTQIA
jgi:hypothetical protein